MKLLMTAIVLCLAGTAQAAVRSVEVHSVRTVTLIAGDPSSSVGGTEIPVTVINTGNRLKSYVFISCVAKANGKPLETAEGVVKNLEARESGSTTVAFDKSQPDSDFACRVSDDGE